MVKQFTIPCSFNGETAPVTFYIGHPESGHHPINFQMNWLSSAKGGVVPQDLVDTLKNLQDLAYENGADFEEMCYYALISATSNSTSSNGVTKEAITGYADEFIKNELGDDYVEDTIAAADSQDDTQAQEQSTQQATSGTATAQTAATSQPSSSSSASGGDSDLMDEIDQLLSSIDNADNNSASGSGSSATASASSSSGSSNYSDNDDLLMGDDALLSDGVGGGANSSQANNNSLMGEIDDLLQNLDDNSEKKDIGANSSNASGSQTSDDNSLANEIDNLLQELSGESVGKINGEVNTAVYGEDDDLLG